jgi:hypothetical protein
VVGDHHGDDGGLRRHHADHTGRTAGRRGSHADRIGVIGVFTATVASLLFEEQQTESPEMVEIRQRLDRIEQQLQRINKN